ncbi:MAG: ACT domain-containing protein [Oscillospiraceae bacterium]|nr:ACT domain-containing protein [Oscillospiraceae bacterium]
MKAIITVNAADTVGIIAFISAYLAQHNVNILDISQTIMQNYFVMIMLIDFEKADLPFDQLQKGLKEEGERRNVVIRVQREDIFNAMHRI